MTKFIAFAPLLVNGASTSPSQSLSMVSQASVQPPGRLLQSAFMAVQETAFGPLQMYVPVVRQAP